MAFSELLQHMGNFGRYQIMLVFSTSSLTVLLVTHNLVENFSGAIPAHRCYVHLLDNITSESKHPENLTTEALLRISIPMGVNNELEQCRRFRQTQWQLLNSSDLATNTTELETEACLDGWIYDQSIFTSTIVTQWNLVCKSKSLKLWSQSIFMAGYMLGSLLGGYISDKFGRKTVLLASSLLAALLGTGSIFAPTFPIYCIIRFHLAMSTGTIFTNTLVLLIEWLPSNVTPMIITIRSLVLSTGQIVLPGLAYVFRDWRMLQLSISVPYFVFFLSLWWTSESVRWLIVSGKLEKALKVMKKVAHTNGKKDVEETLNIEVLQSAMREELTFLKQGSKKIKVMASPIMCKTLFLLFFMRFSAIFFVYGVLTDLKNLGSNMFLSQALLGAVDFPSKCLSFLIMKFLKRRPSIASALFLGGFCILINIFVPKDMPYIRLGLTMLGKGSMAIYFSMNMIYSHELIPTGLRSRAEGGIIFMTGLASSLSSLAFITRQYFEHLPTILHGTFPIVAAICVYFLPETLNLPLPDTIQDLERRHKNYKKTSTNGEESNDLQGTTEC
ncbi:solute carrier family 22 member 10-like [Myotis lucifugus]|uniref:Major facilitator superfamily (MFS) profile domain-containing protein n=1 Tax=Myotis lucifugus TaxID=59463 RepID=G1Q8Y0_MYOLU|nr:solute carrier family 22 member 10-like [Myotis lucifugus]